MPIYRRIKDEGSGNEIDDFKKNLRWSNDSPNWKKNIFVIFFNWKRNTFVIFLFEVFDIRILYCNCRWIGEKFFSFFLHFLFFASFYPIYIGNYYWSCFSIIVLTWFNTFLYYCIIIVLLLQCYYITFIATFVVMSVAASIATSI